VGGFIGVERHGGTSAGPGGREGTGGGGGTCIEA
jgi:hypothetical protein